MRFPLRVVAASWVAWAISSVAVAQPAPPLPPNPRLLLDQKDVAALKEKIAGPFATQWQAYKAEADAALAKPVELPPRGGNWSHNYVCPEHGARLKLAKKIGPWEWEHTCPVGPHTLRGNPEKATLDFDGNAIASVHGHYADEARQLGVVFQVTGDEKYARRAREILLAYAEQYRKYPVHDNQGRPGGKGAHVASQSLTEASWLINMVQGADLVWQTLSADDRKQIEAGLFRPALDEVILPAHYGIHNIQCRLNSAIGLVGFLLDDPKLIARAIDDPNTGFRTQIAKGVLDDGMWTEGASGYHFFTIDGLWPLAEAARHCGVDLYSPRFKSMYDAPIALAMPNLKLPNFNDSGIVDVSSRSDSYELAYARWHDDAYLPIVRAGSRRGETALLYGVPELPDATKATSRPASHNSPASGYAILQKGEGENATWLCIKYGPHGGGHGHPDKNHFILYAAGHVLCPDAGTHAYGSPLHTSWDKTTLAHNTLVVDEKSQSPATGKCLAFGSAAGVDFAMTDAGPIYPDAKVSFTRTVFLLDPTHIVGIDQATAGDGEQHTFDLTFHLTGQWDGAARASAGTLPDAPGYSRLSSPMFSSTNNDVSLQTQWSGSHQTRLFVSGGKPTNLITAIGIGDTTEDHVPTAILRRHGKSATYVWSITLGGDEMQPEIVAGGDGFVAVRAGDHFLLSNPTGQAARIPLPAGEWSTSDRASARPAK